MKLSDFDYELPSELIAQTPIKTRDQSRLMVLDKKTGEYTHKHFYDIINELHKGDVLVLNDTKVIPARLIGTKEETGAVIELLLLKDLGNNIWECLSRPAKRLKVGTTIIFSDKLKAEVVEKKDEGLVHVKLLYKSILMEISKLNYWVTPEAEEVFNQYKESRITKEKMELLDYLIQQYTNYEEQTMTEYRKKEEEITKMIVKRENIRERKSTAKKLIFSHLHTEKYKKYHTELSQVTNKNRKIYRVLQDLKRLKKIESTNKKTPNR